MIAETLEKITQTIKKEIALNIKYIYWYLRSEAPEDILKAVYDNPRQTYLDEKLPIFQRDMLAWFIGELDEEHQVKIVTLASNKYGK